MKAIAIALMGAATMAAISIMSGLQCKKSEPPVWTSGPMLWSRDHVRPDGCMVTYYWYDPTGNYPFTKDTCCLDSVIIDARYNCWSNAKYDSISNKLNIEITCDSILITN